MAKFCKLCKNLVSNPIYHMVKSHKQTITAGQINEYFQDTPLETVKLVRYRVHGQMM